ncbi:MAG: hypothetical protein ACFCBW_17590 [Candidatus Competibacterales bacterium]
MKVLCHWITFLSRALPKRSVPVFIELLIATMLTSSGHVTDAYLVIQAQGHWTSYYRWLAYGKWSWLHLARYNLLATDLTLTPKNIIRCYARRWAIEPMFATFRHHFGARDAWQQSRQVLARWIQLLSTGYLLTQLLTLANPTTYDLLRDVFPWRRQRPITDCHLRRWLQQQFSGVNLRAWWDPKTRQFRQPLALGPPTLTEIAA